MKTLPIRVLSAGVVLTLMFLTINLFGLTGLQALVVLISFIGTYEYTQLMSHDLTLKPVDKLLYFLFSSILIFVIYNKGTDVTYWSAIIFAYVSSAIWITRNRLSNEKLHALIMRSTFGFLYCVALPGSVLFLLFLPSSQAYFWFFYLLFIVLIGDTAAFFGGILLGNKKLMPSLSPSKTIAGAISGAIGSVLAAFVYVKVVSMNLVEPLYFDEIHNLNSNKFVVLLLLTLFAAFFAQTGDLFESLLKRVANKKDSGNIMPGHGGVLDRLDGVFFAAPFVYLLTQLI